MTRKAHLQAEYVKSVISLWGSSDNLILPENKEWEKKNPEIHISIDKERVLTHSEWSLLNFPVFKMPPEVRTHVNLLKWREKMDLMSSMGAFSAEQELMEEVYKDLSQGCDSMVMYPGNTPTQTRNEFEDPSVVEFFWPILCVAPIPT